MITVRLELKNKNIRETFERIIDSLEEYRLQKHDTSGYCDLLIMEFDDSVNGEFNKLYSLKESGQIGDFFLTSSSVKPDVLISALRAGAKEFFPQPLKGDEIMSSLRKFRDQLNSSPDNHNNEKNGRVINVVGSKGGVGTTTVAVNLAAGLNESRDAGSVVVIDMNLLFGEIPLFFDVKTAFNWGEVVKNISRVDSTYLMSVLAKHPSGVYVLPSPADIDGIGYTNPDIIEQLIGMMKKQFDYIVIDNGQSLNLISQKLLELSDVVFVVSILSLPCLINVKKLLKTFWNLGYPREDRVKIVMNRYHKKSVLSVKEAEEGLEKKISWLIPNDFNATMSAINQGKVLSEIAKSSEISRSFSQLADSLTDTAAMNRAKGRKGLLNFKLF